jgi:hypothetical protein
MIFERGGPQLVATALDCFDGLDVYRESFSSWFMEIEKKQPLVIAWLSGRRSLGPVNQLGLSLVLDPFFEALGQFGSVVWKGVENDSNPRRLAFILFLSATERSDVAAAMFSTSFRMLHRIANGQDLGFFAWRILQDGLPHLSLWKDWDMCERLRHFYCIRFFENRWPVQEFWNGLEGTEVTREVFDFIASERGLRDFGRNLLSSAEEYSLPPWQHDLLSSMPKKLRK